MGDVWTEYVPWIYISLQGLITLIVSVMGVKYARNEFLSQKKRTKQGYTLSVNTQENDVIIQNMDRTHNISTVKDEQISLKAKNDQIQTGETELANPSQEIDEKENSFEDNNAGSTITIQSSETQNESEEYEMMSKMGFCKLWFNVVWEMRSVYCSLAVHSFDVLTDVLVIISWWNLEEVSGDNINSKIMAWCGITILLFHKFISVIAFWAKEANIIRCVLQFLDFLIFEEIYLSHKKIISQFKNQSNEDEETEEYSVETTSTFKFVRNLEAIFESIPQSILQLVFIMRTSAKLEGSGTLLVISVLSIFQSIVSMTNSILKNDNVYMTLPKFKPCKKRLPPTIPFLKHALSRLSEVIYRIGLCALFWTVCEGTAFGVLMGAELCILIIMSASGTASAVKELSADDLCLQLQTLIVMPSELFYERKGDDSDCVKVRFDFDDCENCCNQFFGFLFGLLVCYTPAVWLSTLCLCHTRRHYVHISLRIGISMIEWIILIIWALVYQERYVFLFSFEHGLSVLILSMICYCIYSQYTNLFPDFSLPHGIGVRSIYGYAFNGELEELQRIKIPKNYTRSWDQRYIYDRCITCAMLALSNKQYHVVEWLETEKGAWKHKQIFDAQKQEQEGFQQMDHLFGRHHIGVDYWKIPKLKIGNTEYY
eukprot:351428_1